MTIFEFFNNKNIIDNTSRKLISVSGGGGKTSFLYRYATSFNKRNLKLLVTSTTKMYYPNYASIFDRVIISKNLNDIISVGNDRIIFAMQSEDKEKDKLIGFDKSFLETLFMNNIYDIIVSESDGSRGKSIKAPLYYEPTHPSNATDIVGIIGLSSYKKTINISNVHRVNSFTEITNTKIGDVIDIDVLVSLINSKLGLFKSSPISARKHLLINQCDTTDVLELDYIFNTLKDKIDNVYSIIFCSFLKSSEIIKYFIFHERKMIL